jgi:hypothetical protein
LEYKHVDSCISSLWIHFIHFTERTHKTTSQLNVWLPKRPSSTTWVTQWGSCSSFVIFWIAKSRSWMCTCDTQDIHREWWQKTYQKATKTLKTWSESIQFSLYSHNISAYIAFWYPPPIPSLVFQVTAFPVILYQNSACTSHFLHSLFMSSPP